MIVKSAADTLKRVTLELGGKSPNIFFDGADWEAAVDGGFPVGAIKENVGRLAAELEGDALQGIRGTFDDHFSDRSEERRVGKKFELTTGTYHRPARSSDREKTNG